MLDKYLQIETFSLVFIGDFNPIILQPFWLVNKNLIREDEANNAKIEVIHNEIVKFDLDWVEIEITKNRCQFKSSKEPYFEPVKDLAVGIFKILKETPIKSLGINYIYDLTLLNEKNFFTFGEKLAILSIWDDIMEKPRLLTLEIKEQTTIEEKRYRRIKITPSDQNILFGVTVNVNNHFEINSNKGTLMGILKIEESLENVNKSSKQLLLNLFNKIISQN